MALFSNSLAIIRQYLSSAVGDLVMGTADSGTVNTLVDDMLRKPTNYYTEHKYRVYIYNGPAAGQEREVSNWVLTNTELTVAPNFTNAITSASQWELHYVFTSDELLKAINLGIESSAGKYLIDIKDETTIPLVANTYEYALPLSMLYLYRIITESAVSSSKFYNEDIIDPRYWSIIKSYPPTLKLDKNYYSIVVGKYLRLEGQGTQPKVDDDADLICLPPDWLVNKAITFLPWNKIQSNKLDEVYRKAVIDSAIIPRTWPHPKARRVVE